MALAAALAPSPPAAHASPSQEVLFDAADELRKPSTRDAAFAELERLGVNSLRVVLFWNDVAPASDARERPDVDLADPAAYSWTGYDEIMAGARERGWKVLLTPSTPGPRWAMEDADDHVTRPDPREFAKFVTAAAKRYGEQIDRWSVLNEPNHPKFLQPQYRRTRRGRVPASPRIYRRLFQAADRALEATGNGDDLLLMGETAPHSSSSVVGPITFLRGTLCLNVRYRPTSRCARLDADGYAHHPYSTNRGPFFGPPRGWVTIGVLDRLERALDRAARAGMIRRRMPLWLTEFGVQSTPDRFVGVSLRKQVEYRALSERIAYGNKRVEAFSQYLLRDDDPIEGKSARERYGGFESGLKFATGVDKPSLEAFRLTLSPLRTRRGVRLWGVVRPAGGPTRAEILVRDRGEEEFRVLKTVETNSRGYFSSNTNYRRGREYKLRWQGDESPAVGVSRRG